MPSRGTATFTQSTARVHAGQRRNVHDDGDITAAAAVVRTVVITAREDLQIAHEARWLLGPRQPQ